MIALLTISDESSPAVKAEFARLMALRDLASHRVERAEAKAYAAKHELAEACDASRRRYDQLVAFVAAHPAPQMEMFAA